MARNITVEDTGTTLIITIDKTQELGESSSGKSIMVATTDGNMNLDDGLQLGLNLFRPKRRNR